LYEEGEEDWESGWGELWQPAMAKTDSKIHAINRRITLQFTTQDGAGMGV
jgi:hypothetical protein